jgi:hypothetical protein
MLHRRIRRYPAPLTAEHAVRAERPAMRVFSSATASLLADQIGGFGARRVIFKNYGPLAVIGWRCGG